MPKRHEQVYDYSPRMFSLLMRSLAPRDQIMLACSKMGVTVETIAAAFEVEPNTIRMRIARAEERMCSAAEGLDSETNGTSRARKPSKG